MEMEKNIILTLIKLYMLENLPMGEEMEKERI